MALDEKRRQKKLAKRSAKRKAHRSEIQHKSTALGAAYSPTQAAQFPLHECLVSEQLFELGIGNALLSRFLPNGELAVAVFLLDVYCLGVKTAFYRITSPQEYVLNRSALGESATFRPVDPACLHKLVEAAVDYARSLGLEPDADYARTAKLFGDIDAAACPEQYAFGHEGKPFYITGPRDSPAKVRRILDTLQRRLGPEGFDFLIGAPTSDGDIDADLEEAEAEQAESALEQLGYEITDEPLGDSSYARLPETHHERIQAIYEQLQAEQPQEVLAELPALIEQYPDVPQLYNHLYTAYHLAGDRAGAERVLAETLQRFPDYLFGRVSYAVECLQQDKPERIPEIFDDKLDLRLLYPERKRFHVSEVMGFYTVLAWYLITQGDRVQAERYYQLLREIDPDHRNTHMIAHMLYPPELMSRLRDLLRRAGRKARKSDR
jgi:tetratricopeptide (TPR) repeat protein